MDFLPWILLAMSATLASTKNILVKGLSGFSIKNREFFGVQALIFASGSVVLLVANAFDFNGVSWFTFWISLVYGVLLIGAMWFYNLSLTMGKTAVCATVYSFGFVLPTLSGWLFWGEDVSVFAAIGIVMVFPVLIISGTGSKKGGAEAQGKKYIIYLIIAMLCSGALGIVQKIQQKSAYANQKNTFILLAFFVGLAVSLAFFFANKSSEKKIERRSVGICALVGMFYSVCNMINTHLAGTLDSAIFFPALNIGSIVISMLLGLVVYKERLAKKDVLVLLLGAVAIFLVNL